MTRICQIMECTIGGTRRHVRDLSGGLVRRGFDVTLVASAVRDPTFRDDLAALAAEGVDVIELPMVREIRPHLDAGHQWRLARLFARERFRVIHTHSSKAGALGRVGARIARVGARIVHTPHTFAFQFADHFSPRRVRFFLGVERLLGQRTDRLVHVSRSEQREAAAYAIVPEERTVVIPNGIDPGPFATADGARVRAELGIGPGTRLVGTVGLLNAAKGHADLIDAAARLRAAGEDAAFVIAGDGELRGALEER
ncbi:MAG: glycosyltransferase, partial [Planctomycetota bacterium JB042]